MKARRNTPQRQLVLEELKGLCSHPTARELYEIVRTRLPKISLGTVYRNLEFLAEAGVIQKLGTGGSEARFDANLERHHHVRCVRCGRVDDIQQVPPDVVKPDVTSKSGYAIIGLRLEFIGVCPECGRCEAPQGEG